MSPDAIRYFEGLVALYGDNIRASDSKASNMIFLMTFTTPTIVVFRSQLPGFIPIYLLLLIPLCAIASFIFSMYPRYVVTPGFPFYYRKAVSPEDFPLPPHDGNKLLALFQNRCATLAGILYWKVRYFRIGLGFTLLYLAVLFTLALVGVYNTIESGSAPAFAPPNSEPLR